MHTPRLAAYRACPACARRYAMQIDLDCPICGGAGLIALGPKPHHRDPARALALIERGIERAAEPHTTRAMTATDLTKAAADITATIALMRYRKLTLPPVPTLQHALAAITQPAPAPHRAPRNSRKPAGHNTTPVNRAPHRTPQDQ